MSLDTDLTAIFLDTGELKVYFVIAEDTDDIIQPVTIDSIDNDNQCTCSPVNNVTLPNGGVYDATEVYAEPQDADDAYTSTNTANESTADDTVTSLNTEYGIS